MGCNLPRRVQVHRRCAAVRRPGWEASWRCRRTRQPRPPTGGSSWPCWDSALPRRRRPSGQPPLPHHLQTTGVGWLVAAVVLVALSLVVFADGLRGRAVAVTVVDDAVVGWLAGLEVPGLVAAMRGLAALGSWTAMNVLLWGLLLALLVLSAPAAAGGAAGLDSAGGDDPVPAGPAGAAAAAVRGRVPHRLDRLGAAV